MTPVNWHLTVDEAAYIVGDCEAKALVTTADLVSVAQPCRDVPALPGGARRAAHSRASSRPRRGDGGAPATPLPDPAVGTTMLYTSGTTGRPKGVHRDAPAASAATTFNIAGYDEGGGDVHLCTGPLYHAAPLAFSLAMPLAFGATVVLMDAWDARESLRLVEDHGVTHTHMVPTMFHQLLSLPDEGRCPTTCRACATSCTAPRRAPSRSSAG